MKKSGKISVICRHYGMNQNFSSLLLKRAYLKLQRLFHKTSYHWACHYETLKLQKNCSSKQIRDAFIKLSKENHPDINKHPDAHKKFVKIQEAYNVLSKPDTRANYDLGLPNSGPHMRYETHTRPGYGYGPNAGPYRYTEYRRNPWDDPSFYHNRDRSRDAQNEDPPYYGIKGIKKMSNGSVAFLIMSFAAMVFIFQMFVISHMFTIQQTVMNRRSMQTQQILNEIKAEAERNGNEVQIEIRRKQFEELERLRERMKASKREG